MPLEQSELKPLNIIDLVQDKFDALTVLSKGITIHPSYFDQTNGRAFCLPKILKQGKEEADEAHATRVKNHLTLVTDEQFANIGHLVDPDDPTQARFLHLYTEIQSFRALHKK